MPAWRSKAALAFTPRWGDPARLRIVDALQGLRSCVPGSRGPGFAPRQRRGSPLCRCWRDAGLIARHPSEGDHRRRYITLRAGALDELGGRGSRTAAGGLVRLHPQLGTVAVRGRTLGAGDGQRDRERRQRAGSEGPSDRRSSRTRIRRRPARRDSKGYDAIKASPDIVVSVCDRAFEAGAAVLGSILHWSIPDPVAVGTDEAFRSAFAELARRVARLSTPR